jgi:2-methylisocitrate lyase-like PEP mutase family enzyme
LLRKWTSPEQKAAPFRALHEGEAFVVPNPWDAGSARVFEALDFKALATTSAGFAWRTASGPSPRMSPGAISRAAEAGAVGGSIEDYGAEDGIYDFNHAVERVAAVVEAARRLDFPFTRAVGAVVPRAAHTLGAP